jgi:hypothetical protein
VSDIGSGTYDFDGNPISYAEWGQLFANTKSHDREVAHTRLPGGVTVSTVWLGIDYRFWRTGAPLIYETMIFGGPHDNYRDHYPNRVAALAGHDQAVKMASTYVTDKESNYGITG